MAKISSKSGLAIELSKLEGFGEHSIELEQYTTPSEITAEILWEAALKGHISNKVILDAGCGTGILGLGALLLGAKEVFFVEVSDRAIEIAKKNYESLKNIYELGEARFIEGNISDFEDKVDCALMNPPFGTKEKHADKTFLETAFKVSRIIYSMHKLSTRRFVEVIAKEHNFKATLLHKINFPIKNIHKFHTKKKYNTEVGVWLLEV